MEFRIMENDRTGENLYTALDAVDLILKHITQLDRARDEKELAEILPGLLESIGYCTRADRVYIFEWELEESDFLNMTYEWCTDQVSATKSVMQHVPVTRFPNWLPKFQRGEAVIARDWQKDQTLFPEENQFLGGQNIGVLMALPIFSNDKFNGYIGLDDPKEGMTDMIIRLLASVSGHIGSVKEKLHMVKELQDKHRQLERNLLDLEYEKKLHDALSIDYTAVYYCDLLKDTIVPIKEFKYQNTTQLDRGRLERDLKEKINCYSSRVRYYYDHAVVKESSPDFVDKLSIQHLRKTLEKNERMIYRFRAKPNKSGQEYFEVQVVRLRHVEGFQTIMGFRYIDDVLEEQDRQRLVLEKALAEAHLNNEIISSISKIFWMIYRLDLQTDTYEEIAAGQEISRLTGKWGSIEKDFVKTRTDVVAPEHREKMETFFDIHTLAERLKDSETIATEYHAVNGSWYRARFIVKKRDAQGRVTNVLYLDREINEEKQQELEYEEKLTKTAEEALRANMAKTDFLRRMSHDIRTPINGIRGIISIANHYPEDLQKQQECRDKAMEASGFLLDLVNHVLDMNKLESGTIVLERTPFDLLELFQDSNSIMEVQSQMDSISFVVDNHDITHTRLLGSPIHIRQILQNIVGNAIKYNRPGGTVKVTCREISCEDGKAFYEMTCSDTGYGMSQEFQKRAFEPFAQEQNDARTRYMGTGLGLSIVKQLIELMGGTITLESERNVGTKFTFVLPFEIDPDYREQEKFQKDVSEISLEGFRVLLVEDNELNMEIARFTLEQAGIIVTSAWNGREATELFAKSDLYEFDLILMDVMMPVMGGLDATRAIRSMERKDATTIPIFAMTANAFQEDIQQSREAGMNEHLSKPLQKKEMIKAIKRYLRKREDYRTVEKGMTENEL